MGHNLLTMFAGGGGGDTGLQGIVASTVADLWFADTACYSGSGTDLLNLTAAPADGSAQTDNDWETVNTSGVPTTMTHDGAKFTTSGSNLFEFTGTNTTFIKTMQQVGSSWWIAIYAEIARASTLGLFSTGALGGTCGIASLILSSGVARIYQDDGVAATAYKNVGSYPTTKELCIFTYDDTAAEYRTYFGGTKSTAAVTYNTAVVDASHVFRIGAYSSGANQFDANEDIYGFSYGNDAMSDDDAAAMKTYIEAR